MAISANTVLEVRTTGSDTNSGGFVTGAVGADFSQQDSKNITQQGVGTTLSGNGGSITSGATTCKVASITNLYGAAQALLATPLVNDWIKMGTEISKVTAVNLGTLTLTITRGQLGTVAASHNDGDTVTNVSNVSMADLVTAGTTTITSLTAFWSANVVGNLIYVAGGTGSLTGVWKQITAVGTSVASTTITVDSSTGIGASTGATGNVGGALGSPGLTSAIAVTSNTIWIKSGTYSITSATQSVSGGCPFYFSGTKTQGYTTVRGDLVTAPVLQASGITTAKLLQIGGGNGTSVINLTVDGQSLASITGVTLQANSLAIYIKAINCTNGGFSSGSLIGCSASGCSTTGAAFSSSVCYCCEASSNSIPGFSACNTVFCVSYGNTGASSHGFTSTGTQMVANCVAYGNGGNGFSFTSSLDLINCVAEGNGGFGFSSTTGIIIANCATYNNTSGATHFTGAAYSIVTVSLITYTTSAFINVASGNFALNSTTGGGASLRAAGIPGVSPDGLSTGYLDIGAFQHQDTPAVILARVTNVYSYQGEPS